MSETVAAALLTVWLCTENRLFLDIKVQIQKGFIEVFKFSSTIKPFILGYKLLFKTADMYVYRNGKLRERPLAMNDRVIVFAGKDLKKILIKSTIFPGFKYRVDIDKFDGIIRDSHIEKCLILPYFRTIDTGIDIKVYRIVLITDKAQIYHNFPDRGKNISKISKPGDLLRFEESVIWDSGSIPYPSDHMDADNTAQYYFPGLPGISYEYFPKLNSDESFTDRYGNGGFPERKSLTIGDKRYFYNRFYISRRTSQGNPFYFMGGLEYDERLALLGTYRSNTDEGVRTCIFASSDGGREWYKQYEFGDAGIYEFRQGRNKVYGRNWGNSIIFRNDEKMFSSRVSLIKRKVKLTNHHDTEPEYEWNKAAVITGFFVDKNGEAVFETNIKHGLSNGNIVAFSGKMKEKWFVNAENDLLSERYLFKSEVIDAVRFKIHEFVSVNGKLPCRHIHSINKMKDGYIVGTGEIYPNGWELFVEKKKSDNGHVISGGEPMPVIRLNSSEFSVQRIMGMIWEEGKEIIIASDHDLLPRKEAGQRNELIDRNSLGIYRGSMENIDSFCSFDCMLDLYEPSYFFKKIFGIIFNCGQRGEFCYSSDMGNTWIIRKMPTPFENYTGIFQNGMMCGEYIIVLR